MEIDEQLITKHLDIWSSVKKARSRAGRGLNKKLELYGIAKLRGLILDLAVRGLLVPQENNDEPAANLIERIAKEKSNLVKQGKLKNTKRLTPVSAEEAPFKTAPNWEWTRLGEVLIKITDGTHHSPPNSESGDYRYISAKNIKKDGIQLNNTTWISKEIHDEIYSRCDPEKGDILYIKDGATTGIATINDLDEPFSMLSSVALLKCPKEVLNSYLLLSLRSPYFYREMRSEMTGVAITRVTLKKLNYAFISLPPLAEQHRIVAKVDELIALCDQLEQEQESNLEAHETLVSTLLNALTSNTADASQFADAWQRIQDNFDTLFTTENSVDQLKQTILQLAVMGKLVPQDPEDEPVEKLLEKIASKKEKMIKDKIIPKQKPLQSIRGTEKNIDLPQGWQYTKIDDLCGWVTSGSTPPKSEFTKEERIPYLKVYNIREQRIDFEYRPQFITENCQNKLLKRSILRPGDVVMNIVGPPLGKTAIIPDTYSEWNCNQAIAFFRLLEPKLNSYIHTFLKAGSFLDNIELIGTAGQDNISVTKSRNIVIPLPPLAEQHRVVAKVDELMALCDQLKSNLTNAHTTQLDLADSLVEQAVK